MPTKLRINWNKFGANGQKLQGVECSIMTLDEDSFIDDEKHCDSLYLFLNNSTISNN